MSEVVHHPYNNNDDKGSSSTTKTPGLSKYNYMCDDCGEAFHSLDEYIEHYKHYHPRSIGTSIT
jgi:hypothetical protein